MTAIRTSQTGANGWGVTEDEVPTLDGTSAARTPQGVRRLTPTECERLQSFPDGWTAIEGAPDSRRYAALGDAVTVNVARWIGLRLKAVEEA